MKTIILAVFLCPLLVCGQLSEKNYHIYSVKLSKEVSLNEIVDAMSNYDVLFFGEEHNDSVTHFLEKSMLELLYAKFQAGLSLSMEMFDRDVQPIMNEYLKDFIREKSFVKDARAWSNYKDYRPMVEFAKTKGLNIICANAPTRYTNLAGRKGQQVLMDLPKDSKNYFAPLPYDTATGPYYEKLLGVTHGPADTSKNKMPVMQMGGFNMVTAQSLWDATMAYSIAEYLKRNKNIKIMQVNGKFHSDEGFAVVTQLKNYRPKTKVLIISSSSDDSFPNIDWNTYKQFGDYIIITDPKVPKTFKD
jgi:uncharacterized iron-regulated protein